MDTNNFISFLLNSNITKITCLFYFLTACNHDNHFYQKPLKFLGFNSDHDTLIIEKPSFFSVKDSNSLAYRYQFIEDTIFVTSNDTISYEIYYDTQTLSDYYLNCFQNHVFKYSVVISPEIFTNKIDSNLINLTKFSEPEILLFSKKYKKLFVWFNVGLPNQESFLKGLVGINEKGIPWFRELSSNVAFEKYQYFCSNDEENVILSNYVIQLSDQKVNKIEMPFIFSGFLNSQTYFLIDDPVQGDTFVQETIIDEWGNEKVEYYRIEKKDSINKNLVIFNLNGDTLYKFRFDGICQDNGYRKLVSFAKSDSLRIAVFYDFHRKILRVFDLLTLSQKAFSLKNLISDYPENLPYLDLPSNCLDNSHEYHGVKKLRIFFSHQKPLYYLFLYDKH